MKKLMKVLSVFVMAFALVALAGCAPKDLASAKEKMVEAGYTCLDVNIDNEEGVVGIFSASKNLIGGILGQGDADALIATLYDSSKSAKAALADAEKDAEENQVAKVIGKWVVVGTEQAIKDFK